MQFKKKIFIFISIPLLLLFLFTFLQQPSLNKDWANDQITLSKISFSWNIVWIKNIRDYRYKAVDKYDVRYYDKKINLDEVESVYYIIEPFSDYDWPAHTMLSFWFKDWTYLVISAEIRKEKWESFSALLWLLNQYEMVYIIWDENDLIKLRANYRKDDVFMYPIKTSKQNIKRLFISALKEADKLSKEPEFYNTFTNTCITSILKHVNILREDNWKTMINWSKQVFLPSHSDQIAYDLGLLDTELPLEEAREYYKINELSEKHWNDKDYSKLIRRKIK